jgi:hypothetical protein
MKLNGVVLTTTTKLLAIRWREKGERKREWGAKRNEC